MANGKYQYLLFALVCVPWLGYFMCLKSEIYCSLPPDIYQCRPKTVYTDGVLKPWEGCDAQEACNNRNEFRLDPAKGKDTWISEFDLSCEKEYLLEILAMTLIIGEVCGDLLFGQLGDNIGRKKTLMICSTGFIFSSFIIIFAQSIYQIILGQIFVGMFLGGTCPACFSWILEDIPRKSIVTYIFGLHLVYPLAEIFFAITYYIHPTWNYLYVFICCFLAIVPICLWYFEESPRFFIARNEPHKAVEMVDKINKINLGKDYKLKYEQHSRSVDVTQTSNRIIRTHLELGHSIKMTKAITIVDLVVFKSTRSIFLVLCILCFSTGLILTLSEIHEFNFTGNLYANILINGALFLVGALFSFVASIWMSRRILMIIFALTTGISAIIYANVYHHPVGGFVFALVRIGFAGAMVMINTICFELMPTVARVTAYGAFDACYTIGMLVVQILDYYDTPGTIYVFAGIIKLLAAICIYIIPESKNIFVWDHFEEVKDLDLSGKKSLMRFTQSGPSPDPKPRDKRREKLLANQHQGDFELAATTSPFKEEEPEEKPIFSVNSEE